MTVVTPSVVRRLLGWPVIGGGTLTATVFLIAALRVTPPAFDVARSCIAMIAILLAAKVLAWVAVSGARFGREERLLAFVMLAACGLGWIGAGQGIEERAFDYRAAQQKNELMRALRDTSTRLTEFCDARDHGQERLRVDRLR